MHLEHIQYAITTFFFNELCYFTLILKLENNYIPFKNIVFKKIFMKIYTYETTISNFCCYPLGFYRSLILYSINRYNCLIYIHIIIEVNSISTTPKSSRLDLNYERRSETRTLYVAEQSVGI